MTSEKQCWFITRCTTKFFLRFCLLFCFYTISAFGQHFPNHLERANCDRVTLKGPKGVIKSPGYPIGYHNHTSCSWIIRKEHKGVVTLRFTDLDIEEDSETCDEPPCCNSNWVKIAQRDSAKQFCGQNQKLPVSLLFEGNEISVKFHTSVKTKGGRGFQLNYFVGLCLEGQYRCYSDIGCYNKSERCNSFLDCLDFSDELNCGFCAENHTSCGLPSTHCYNPFTQRCNRILDCPNARDELNCETECENKIQCNNGIGCYSSNERCDGVPQCRDDSDEKLCENELCRSENGGFLCGNNRCIREIWNCDGTEDCEDGTDEKNCIKNSVITAAVMGSLICGLLLVVAISCSCKLYALRNIGNNTVVRETPLSRLEREFLYREPPPSYAVAVGDPRACFPDIFPSSGSRRNSHRHGRRSRSHRQRAMANRPPPIVEEVPENFHSPGIIANGVILEIERRSSSDSSGDSSRRNSNVNGSSPDSVTSAVTKETSVTSGGDSPISNAEQSPIQSTSLHAQANTLWKTDSSDSSSLAESTSTNDHLPLLAP